MLDADTVLGLTRNHESRAVNTFRMGLSPPVFVRGEGAWLFEESGAAWLDFVCGSSTSNLGHGYPPHIEAIREVVSSGILHTGTRLPSPYRAGLYQSLCRIMPEGLDCIHLGNSGAEAIETAIKVAQHATGRSRLMAFEGGYHGRTLGALSLSSGMRIRDSFSLLESNVDILPYPYPEDPAGEGFRDEVCSAKLSERLDQLDRAGDLPAAVFIEAVQGVGGVLEPRGKFLADARELTSRYGVLLVCDEIWSGFGRAGKWFSFERSGIIPDIIAMGKAVSGGLPLSATAASSKVLKSWGPGMHTSTFQGNPLSCATADATVRAIGEGRLLDYVSEIVEPMLREAFHRLELMERIHAVRVIGAQAAIEFLDRQGKPGMNEAVRVQKAALEQKILIYSGGRNGNAAMIVPPINIDRDDLAMGLAQVRKLIEREATRGAQDD
ncbi:MAG: aspartate aminotransferase family protein [Albidovulum sp.]|nr:aspartate aminotransferase family protein [Albidovulum sp.]MDE0304474.1 aspartate aminotransferase family protein [Albidovulum sp.]